MFLLIIHIQQQLSVHILRILIREITIFSKTYLVCTVVIK